MAIICNLGDKGEGRETGEIKERGERRDVVEEGKVGNFREAGKRNDEEKVGDVGSVGEV